MRVEEVGLVFVRFKVVDEVDMGRDGVAGWCCVRLQRLRQGVRVLRVCDTEGVVGEGRVLCRISWSVSGGGLGGDDKGGMEGLKTAMPVRGWET